MEVGSGPSTGLSTKFSDFVISLASDLLLNPPRFFEDWATVPRENKAVLRGNGGCAVVLRDADQVSGSGVGLAVGGAGVEESQRAGRDVPFGGGDDVEYCGDAVGWKNILYGARAGIACDGGGVPGGG